jgi:hypothetical protein
VRKKITLSLQRSYIYSVKMLVVVAVRLQPLPNVVVQWLSLLLGIREVPGSNLGPETAYND